MNKRRNKTDRNPVAHISKILDHCRTIFPASYCYIIAHRKPFTVNWSWIDRMECFLYKLIKTISCYFRGFTIAYNIYNVGCSTYGLNLQLYNIDIMLFVWMTCVPWACKVRQHNICICARNIIHGKFAQRIYPLLLTVPPYITFFIHITTKHTSCI